MRSPFSSRCRLLLRRRCLCRSLEVIYMARATKMSGTQNARKLRTGLTASACCQCLRRSNILSRRLSSRDSHSNRPQNFLPTRRASHQSQRHLLRRVTPSMRVSGAEPRAGGQGPVRCWNLWRGILAKGRKRGNREVGVHVEGKRDRAGCKGQGKTCSEEALSA